MDPPALEYFTLWKTEQLKDFLRKRGYKPTHSKRELEAMCYACMRMGVKELPTAEEEKALKAAQYQTLLKTPEGNTLQDPFELDHWISESEGIGKWPKIFMVDMTEYLLSLEDRDMGKRVLNNYKEMKGYSYFDSKWLGQLDYHPISTNCQYCYIYATTTPSQCLSNEPHRLWIMINKKSSRIASAYCTCFAGLGSTCNHVAAALFKLEFATVSGQASCTSNPCEWSEPKVKSRKPLSPKRVKEMVIKKPHYRKLGKGNSIDPKARQDFTPSIYGKPSTIQEITKAMYHSSKDSCLFQYLNVRVQGQPPPPESDFNVNNIVEIKTSASVPVPLPDLIVNDISIQSHTDLPHYNDNEIQLINDKTMGQSDNEHWKQYRIARITASVTHEIRNRICTLLGNTKRSRDITPTLRKITTPATDLQLPALKYGKQMEGEAKIQFVAKLKRDGHKAVSLTNCGLIVKKDAIFVAGSPDGILNCECCPKRVVEIKCPFRACGKDPNSTILPCFKFVNGKPYLKTTHEYYSQIQTQMAVTNLEYGEFVVYSRKGLFSERIRYDRRTFDNLLIASEIFFDKFILKFYRNKQDKGNITTKPHLDNSTTVTDSIKTVVAPVAKNKRVVRKRRKILEKNPIYMCKVCNKECVGRDEIFVPGDESVQCEICKEWYHFICVAYDDEDKWVCAYCGACAL